MVDPSIGVWEENIQELSMNGLIESVNELLSGRTESEMIRGHSNSWVNTRGNRQEVVARSDDD